MAGPWTQILSNFNKAWQAFVEYVNFIDFGKVKAEINGLLALIERLSSRLPGVQNGTLGALQTRRDQIDQGLAATQRALAGNNRGTSSFGGPSRSELLRQQDRLLAQRTDVGTQIATLENAARRRPVTPPDTTLDPPRLERTSRTGRTDNSAERDNERRAAAQADFLEGLQRENDARAFQTTLIAGAEREARILSEIEQARLAALRVGLTLTTDQANAVRASVGAQYDATIEQEAFNQVSRAAFDLARARGEVETREAYVARNLADERLTSESALFAIRADQLGQAYDIEDATRRQADAEKAVTDQFALRSELQNQVQFALDTGDQGTANALLGQLEAVDVALVAAIDNALAFWRAMGGPEAEAAILRLTGARAGVVDFGKSVAVTGKQISDMIAGGAVTAFDQFAKNIAETGNAFGALRDAFLQFAADFLREIAQIIVRKTALNLIDGGGKGGGIGASIASVIGRLFHTGGVAGQGGGASRKVSAFDFASAVRYHSGGMAGFKPNEVPAILEKNEEVLTEEDPRHRNNLKGGGATTVVNVFDPADFLDRALSGEGGRILLNHVSRNSGAFKAAMG